MDRQLYVNHDGMRAIRQTHVEVADGLSHLIGTTPGATSFESTLGAMGSPVVNALGAALPSRETALGITRMASEAIEGVLGAANQMYEQGDVEGAAKLRAAAQVLEDLQADQGDGGGGAGAAGSGTGGGSGGGSGGSGADPAGQVAGQVGQQVGQLGQTLGQSMQGLAQLPMAIMAGVAGIVSAAVGAGGTGGLDDKTETDAKGEGHAESEDEQSPRDTGEPGGKESDEAGARDRAAKGLGLVPNVPAERPAPAQTRPQSTP